MQDEASELERMCERARVRGNQRRVLLLLAGGMDAEDVARELGMAKGTVHVHAGRARRKLLKKQAEFEEREFHGTILTECIRGPKPSRPRTPNLRKLPDGGGERVHLNAGPLVSVDDLMSTKPGRNSGSAPCANREEKNLGTG